MPSYLAYGLRIDSALPLPELQHAPAGVPDALVRIAALDPPALEPAGGALTRFAGDEVWLAWPAVGTFRVRAGREIAVDPASGAEERVLRLPLLGAVLAVLLHQRGLLVLHASAVAIDGTAVVFLGGKGAGKSTIAAAGWARGHRLLADDVVAIDLRQPGGPLVLPGFPQLKLWPEAAAALGDRAERLPPLAPGYSKRAWAAAERFAVAPVPLGYLCALATGPVLALERLSGQIAFRHLVAGSYAARFGSGLLHGPAAAAHFRRCAGLLATSPVYRLQRPVALPMLPAAARLIEERCARDQLVRPARPGDPVIGGRGPNGWDAPPWVEPAAGPPRSGDERG